MSVQIVTPADDFDLSAFPDQFELRTGRVRLRPHSNLNAAHFCDVAGGPFAIPAGVVGINRQRFNERALETGFTPLDFVAVDPGITPFAGYESAKHVHGSGMMTLNPIAEQCNPADFTIIIWFTLDTYAPSKVILSDYIVINGLKRFIISQYNLNRFQGVIYGADGLAGTALDINFLGEGHDVVAGDVMCLKFSYKSSGLTDDHCLAALHVYRWRESGAADNWLLHGSHVIDTAALMPTLVPADCVGLTLFNQWHQYVIPATVGYKGTIHSVRRYTTYDAGALSRPAEAPPAIFDATQSGPVFTQDTGAAGTTCDTSLTTVDDLSQWAAAVGNPGWVLAYEIADVLTGFYSATMTLAAFKALGTLTGRYRKFIFTCVSDGYTNYQLRYFGLDATLPIGTTPATPTIVAYSRVGHAGIAIVGGVAAGDTAHVYAYGTFENTPALIELGSAVSVGGNTTVVLDLTAFDIIISGITIPLPECSFAIAESGGFYSLPSGARSGFFGVSSANISSVVRSADRLSAVVTVAGAVAGETLVIGWTTATGAPAYQSVVGNGAHTILGLDASLTFSPLLIILNPSARLKTIGYAEPRATFAPHSVVYDVPHSSEET